jgi:hypothetical protein
MDPMDLPSSKPLSISSIKNRYIGNFMYMSLLSNVFCVLLWVVPVLTVEFTASQLAICIPYSVLCVVVLGLW